MDNIQSSDEARFLRFLLRVNMVIVCCIIIYPIIILLFGESNFISKIPLLSMIPIDSIYLRIFVAIEATLTGICIAGRLTKLDDLKDILQDYDIQYNNRNIILKGSFALKDVRRLISWISDNKNSLLVKSKDIEKAQDILAVFVENMAMEDLMVIQKYEIIAYFLDMGLILDDIFTRMNDIYEVGANSKRFTVTFKGMKIVSITISEATCSEKPLHLIEIGRTKF
ncbi:hypothetical protein CF100_14365 [Listeria monocytogenes]|uniref:hypothetical protein n=1 Tax=Listeria seeligeri TaxID=1640 RepID=UPI0010D0086F|nr:hypothetical protein [Listeria seeligeri]EAD2540888.1 hypothetical protein [Listeria monocytogenes]EAE2213132.1 hypothetical protein [Listeria monocytogenes]EAF0919701.1 hypothetical protein [Listeria monocytogenes]MBC1775961.1 hypothetical protein [Listeria seeligeri]